VSCRMLLWHSVAGLVFFDDVPGRRQEDATTSAAGPLIGTSFIRIRCSAFLCNLPAPGSGLWFGEHPTNRSASAFRLKTPLDDSTERNCAPTPLHDSSKTVRTHCRFSHFYQTPAATVLTPPDSYDIRHLLDRLRFVCLRAESLGEPTEELLVTRNQASCQRNVQLA
jgi:hypothetical protein